MKIIEPSVSILTPIDGVAVLKHIEACGRTCYKSECKTSDTSYKAFAERLLDLGHESVLEHYSVSVRFICDRGVSHELVRHRLASYSQESTRYCNYSQDRFNRKITVIRPCFMDLDSTAGWVWQHSCEQAERAYFKLLNYGWTPQEARTVLPNSLKTEIVMTANLREWRHFFKLRCDKAAHPQMRQVATLALEQMQEAIPVVFDDLGECECSVVPAPCD